LPTIAAEPVAAGDFRKKIAAENHPEKRVSAAGCPGVAAFSPFCSSEQKWLLATRNSCGFAIERSANRQLASAYATLPWRVARLKRSLRRLRDDMAEQETTNNAVPGGWPGIAFDFLGDGG
jgi:hypothetical protein